MRRKTFVQMCAFLAVAYWATSQRDAQTVGATRGEFRNAVANGGGVTGSAQHDDAAALRQQNARLRQENVVRQAAMDQLAAQTDLATLRKQVQELTDALSVDEARLLEANAASPPHPPAVAGRAGGSEPPRLIIAVNTIPRPADNTTGLEPDYLLRALQSLSDQINAETEGKFAVYVLNLRPAQHSVFATAQEKYAHDPHFVFAETFPDPEDEAKEALAEKDGLGGKDDDAGDGTDTIPLPGPRNRQQTRDVARLTRSVHARFENSPYTLFIEDDFVFCEGSLSLLNSLVARNNGVEMDWTAIRVSYGLCGLIMQRKDLLPFAGYLVEQQYLRPVDILAYYWFARESSQRQPGALAHFGTDLRQFAGCTDVLTVWSLHKHERFDLEACPEYLLSPCPPFAPESDEAKAYSAGVWMNQPVTPGTPALQVREALPFSPTVFVATADKVAGETIPHTAPWELKGNDGTWLTGGLKQT